MEKQSCFVVMGFGEKKIHGTNIILDLDKVYHDFLKPILISLDLRSIYKDTNYRGDEVPTTQAINKEFIKSLFLADFVIADVSTLNQNAIYELGLRHAMKPKSTLIMCDDDTLSFNSFFDISMQSQFLYNHEKLFREEEYKKNEEDRIKKTILNALQSDDNYIDSPVFDLRLYNINPNISFDEHIIKPGKSIREMIAEGKSLLDDKKYEKAEMMFKKVLDHYNDINIFTQYVLAMYKKEESVKNLESTLDLIKKNINLSQTTHEKILGVTAAIYKRLFYLTNDSLHYEYALMYYRNGSKYNSGNLYCARNYCAMLLKKYLVTADKETLTEYFYTAKHNAKIFLNSSRLEHKEYTVLDNIWYNSNVNDLYYIVYGKDESFIENPHATLRQRETISLGRKELINDYQEMKNQI